jgi:hypothetical protein
VPAHDSYYSINAVAASAARRQRVVADGRWRTGAAISTKASLGIDGRNAKPCLRYDLARKLVARRRLKPFRKALRKWNPQFADPSQKP